ncbi:ParB N-terminal domain-containing protein [Marinomonas sp. TW1]|uniref:ParB N-terminal domain-containing protein n=1 Tax=Marinomonas sp. TW1 TaxID=1561203 RepID=UPI0007AFDE66|nr:ParB N-terminal domain-containing protein [Marinomonas sp. TW1]KZN15185.1 hypothetical protein OA79_03035 [Marinomonas sp. TW1]
MTYENESPFEALTRLENDFKTGSEAPQINGELELKQVHEALSLFQPRDMNTEVASKEQHIQNLLASIRNEPTNRLDPIVVWWSGSVWYVLDGHHRLAAYRAFAREGGLMKMMIPVKVFSGTVVQAMGEATRLNSKDKLAMTKDDKSNMAWRFVALGAEGLTKGAISKVCKVSTATVGRMRKKLREIQEFHPDDWHKVSLEMTWNEAINFLERKKAYDDDWQKAQAKEWAKRLSSAFGKKLVAQPEVFLDALEMYSPRLLQDLTEYLQDKHDEDEELDF